jgi:hypothetical protein
MNLKSILSATVVAVGLAVAAPASATLIITAQGQQGGSGDLDNVLFNPCTGNITGPALTVQGCLNTSSTTLVNFTSNENLVVNGGQALVEAQVGTFNTLTIGLANQATGFDEILFNVNAASNGSVTITGTDQFGQTFAQTATLAVGAAGQNFFRVTAIDGQVATSITVFAAGGLTGIDDFRQVRIGTTGLTPVPEPMSLALFGAGLLGLGMVRRKRDQA